jgi:hypothetical protein
MRGFLAGVLAVIGLLLVPLASLGVWTQRELLPTESFTDLASEVMQQPEVQDALAQRVTDEIIVQSPQVANGRLLVQPAVGQVLRTEQFDLVFRAAVANMHAQLRAGDDALRLDLNSLLPVVRDQVAQVNQGVANRIPTSGLPAITVVTRDDVPELWTGVEIGRDASWAIPAIALLLLIAAVVVAEQRATMLIVVGLGLLVIAAILVLVIRFGRDPLSRVVGSDITVEAFNAGYDTVTSSYVTQMLVLAVAGAITAVIGVVLKLRMTGNRRPAVWA